ncbi:MAG TPA: MTH1187 family thiamine-binding protein [Candidatus Sumerlaeota bacterium]|nr:MTH1187 family thiamine-binding protein [Candidatus Sumerlaeota bacterium]
MLAEFSVFPVDKGPHLSEYVAPVIALVRQSGLPWRVTAMGTIVEGGMEEILTLVRACHELMVRDSQRVVTTIRIDDFKGRTGRLEGKVDSIEQKLGGPVNRA